MQGVPNGKKDVRAVCNTYESGFQASFITTSRRQA